MRIVNVVPTICNEADGVGTFVRSCTEAIEGLSASICIASVGEEYQNGSSEKIKTFRYGIGPKRLANSPSLKKWIALEARSGSCDVLHNHGFWMMPNTYALNARRSPNCKLVVSPHGALSDTALAIGRLRKAIYWGLYHKSGVEKADLIHVTGESEYIAIRHFGLKNPVCIIPPGVNLPPLNNEQQKEKVILFLGRIHPIKGIDRMLLSWKQHQKKYPQWRMEVCGPSKPEYLRSLMNMCERHLIERVTFRGAVYGLEKEELMKKAAVSILPSHSENFALSVAESLAAGTAVITTKVTPWIGLTSNNCGWWVESNTDAIGKALCAAIDMGIEELAKMGLRGRTWMKADYTWRYSALQLLRAYHWIRYGGEVPDTVRTD